jgi:hypothetical protein
MAIYHKKPIISGSGATVTLADWQSGATVLFDRAAGIVFTLPAPVVGLYYDFIVTVTRTSNAHTINTNAGTVFILGTLLMARVSDGSSLNVYGDGTAHVSIASNGTTTGGVLGSQFRLTCVSDTVWEVSGIMKTVGAQSTPFA